jgi:hypothetical protein
MFLVTIVLDVTSETLPFTEVTIDALVFMELTLLRLARM